MGPSNNSPYILPLYTVYLIYTVYFATHTPTRERHLHSLFSLMSIYILASSRHVNTHKKGTSWARLYLREAADLVSHCDMCAHTTASASVSLLSAVCNWKHKVHKSIPVSYLHEQCSCVATDHRRRCWLVALRQESFGALLLLMSVRLLFQCCHFRLFPQLSDFLKEEQRIRPVNFWLPPFKWRTLVAGVN